jgi:phosphosulfolactate phosphohydrolase-like enzyme
MDKLYTLDPDNLLNDIGEATMVIIEMQLKACELKDLDRATNVIQKTTTIVKALDSCTRLAAIIRHKDSLINKLQQDNLILGQEIERLKQL